MTPAFTRQGNPFPGVHVAESLPGSAMDIEPSPWRCVAGAEVRFTSTPGGAAAPSRSGTDGPTRSATMHPRSL